MGRRPANKRGLGTPFAPSLRGHNEPRERTSHFAMSAVTLPLSRVEPRLNRVDHHRGERDLLVEGVLADALMKLDRQMNRGLAAAHSAVERTGNQERR